MATVLTKDQENTLQVAQFLTTFQRFFREDAQQQTIISPNDVERATEYRMQLVSHYALQNEVETEGWLSEQEKNELELRLQDSQEALDNISPEIKELHDVLRRFEIRCTKALAAKTLIHCGPAPQHSNSPTQDDWICSSPLLNIPGPNYFSRILPLFPESEVQRVDSEGGATPRIRLPYNTAGGVRPPIHSCSLMLPPNAWTWQEYARITNMMSLLPSNEARDMVLQSTLTGASPLVMPRPRNTRVRDELKLHENAVLTRADLVALWVRSQRNTGALMHLLHLFEIKQVKETSSGQDDEERRRWRIGKGRGIGGKVLEPRRDDDEEEAEDDASGDQGTSSQADKPLQLEARYKGNHRWTKKLVQESAPVIDELVSWAMTNQFSFTDPYIRRVLSKEIVKPTKESKKRALEKDVPPDDPLPKRVKEAAEDSLDELLLCCQAFVLRWFARRHRESLFYVFSSDATGDDDERSGEIQNHLRGYIKERHGSAMAKSRTFARIDRRTLLGIFTNQGLLTFRETVLVLLEGLLDAKAINGDVIEDFRRLCAAFLDGKDGETAARALLETSGSSNNAADLAALLASAPTPWVDRCSGTGCSESIAEEHLVCDFCELSYHPECGGTPVSRKVVDLFALFPHLKRLFPLVIPDNSNPPDFRGMGDWSSYEMRIEKDSSEQIGLDIRQTEHCEAWLRQFLSGCTSGELLQEDLIAVNPLAIDQHGVLVVNVAKESPGERAGLKRNDVITAIRLDSDADWRLLRDMTAKDRVNLLNHDAFAVLVERPQRNIVRASNRWVNGIKQATESVSWKPKQKRKLHCCANCQARGDTAEHFAGEQRDSVRKEALWCRALIRRLGMESFALKFHEESPEDIAGYIATTNFRGDRGRHAMFVSLRRLDSMMEYILVKGQDTQRAAALASAFDLPSWAESSITRNNESRRLDWAKLELESKPLELLCKGIQLLLTPADAHQDSMANERAQLRDRFVLLFTAWCVSAISGASGPPAYALHMRPPWLKPSCTVCHVRSSVQQVPSAASQPQRVCDKESCLQLLESNFATNDQEPDKDSGTANPVRAELRALDRYSSLVGTLLFVLPDDRLIKVLSSELNQPVETMDRALTFLVASYLPVKFSGTHKTSRDIDGVFHILPILGADQLRALSKKCQMRRAPVTDTNDHESWARLEVLELQGVIQMAPSEIEMLLKKSTAIIGAVYAEIARCASLSDADAVNTAALLADTNRGTCQDETARLLQRSTHEMNQGSLAGQRALLCENLSASGCSYFHDMLSMVSTSGTDLLLHDGDRDDRSSNGEQHGALTDAEDDSDESVRSTRAAAVEHGCFLSDVDISEDVNVYRQSLLASLGESTARPSVLYSDLVGHSPNETRAIHVIIKGLTLSPLMQPRSFCDHTILLDRTAYAQGSVGDQWIPPYTGNGWGFEIVDWDKGYQVGRVYPRSFACLAGLKMHDFIVTIAGVPTNQFTKWTHLASAILSPAASDLKEAGEKYPLRQSFCLLKRMKSTPKPIVLTVRRGVAPADVAVPAVRAHLDSDAQVVDLTGTDDVDEPPSQRPHVVPRPYEAQAHPAPGRVQAAQMPEPIPLQAVVQHQVGARVPDPILYPGGIPQQVPQHLAQRNPAIPDQFEITPSNLYLPGLQQTPLSQVETSMLHEAICRNQPQLGRRLLLPRYEVADTMRFIHAVTLASSQGIQIPRVPAALWSYVLRQDYLRSSQETGPFAFEEADPERFGNRFQYRYPTAPLPLDRLAESFFSREDNGQIRDFVPRDILNPVSDNECESSTETAASDVLERIRGGGRSLMNIDHTEWVGKAVRSSCMTCKDGRSFGSTYFVGEVKGCELGLVRVLVFFTGDEGYLASPKYFNFDASDLTSVSEDDPGMKLILLGRFVRTGCLCDERTGRIVHPQRHVEIGSQNSTIEHVGASLLRSLCARANEVTPLGLLPNGSAVFWYQSDPSAIYIQKGASSWGSVHAETRVAFDSDLSKHSADGSDQQAYYCPWGCSNPRGPRERGGNTLRIIPYSTEADLMSHISKHHVPVALPHDSPDRNNLVRIGEGRTILALAADISSAICARCPSLANFTIEISKDEEVTSTLSLIILDISESGRGTPRTLGPLMSTRRGPKSSLLRLLRLWSRIARLFDVNNGGLFRFRKENCISQIARQDVDTSCRKKAESNEFTIACLAGSRCIDSFTGSSVNCRLCGMMGEEPVKCYDPPPQGIERNATNTRYTSCPIGCALFSQVCLPDLPSALQTLRHDLAEAGEIGVVKAFLIHIASITQHALKRVPEESRQSVWEEGNYMNWRSQVERARNLMSLSQAYIVLLRSIETGKLDAWWRNKSSGWNSPGAITRVPSFDALLLHLFVLDLALTQYLTTNKTLSTSAQRAVSHIPEGLRGMTVEDRMKAVLEFASEIGRQPFNGVSNSYCLQCNDGGTLLECEFCENVQHANCSNPPVDDPEHLEAWVCNSCMIDLWKAKGSLSGAM